MPTPRVGFLRFAAFAVALLLTAAENVSAAPEHRHILLAESGGAYLGAIVFAQEIKSSPCGKELSLAPKWTNLERARAEVIAAFPQNLRDEVRTSLPDAESQRLEFRTLLSDPRLAGKCDSARNVFWLEFDRAVRQWEAAKKAYSQ